MLKAVTNAQVVLENGILWDGVVIIEDGKIAKIGPSRDVEIPENAEIIDANGDYVGPGFVDIHVHGGNGYETYYDTAKAAEFFLKHGETTMLATPLYTQPFDDLMKSIKIIKEEMNIAKNVKGIYFEGPFINPKYGSNADLNPWRFEIGDDIIKALVDEAGDLAKVWAIAPERADIKRFVEYARKVNPDTVFAVGHSEATPAEIRELRKYRPTIQTHSMNATGRKEVPAGTRAYGPDEYCFKEPEVYTELISDSYGIHVNPEMQQLLLHNKGIHRVILITDSTNSDMPNPEYLAHIKDLNFDHNGGIYGSRMTMDLACKNIMANTNCGIAQAFLMAATNPARAIGMDDVIGSLDIGKNADMVIVDDKFNVKKVILEGEEI